MISEKPLIIVFDDDSKEELLLSLGYKVDKKSELIDLTGKKANDQDFQPVNINNFGGILQGSKIIIRKEMPELAKYFVGQNSE